MALLNLILGAIFSALGLFDGQGDGGSGGEGGGSPGTGESGSGGAAPPAPAPAPAPAPSRSSSSDSIEDDPDDPPEVKRWKAHARKHEGLWRSLGVKPEDLPEIKKQLAKLASLEDSEKTESQRQSERATKAEKDRDEARGALLRLEVAIEKGLTPAQARRLQGTTKEELEADADELVEAFGGKTGKNGAGDKREPLRRPGATPRSGAVPDAEAEELDPIKLAAKVPRN